MGMDDGPQTLIEQFQEQGDLKTLQKIQVLLRTQPIRWVNSFIGMDGIRVIAEALATTNVLSVQRTSEDVQFQTECVHCFRAILNTKIGMEAFMEERDAVRNLALMLDSPVVATRSQVCFLLAIIASWSNQGFALTLDAINHYKLVKREKTRFQDVVNSLREIRDQEYKANALLMLNALLTSPPDEATRILIQKELRNLGLVHIVEEMKDDADVEELQVRL